MKKIPTSNSKLAGLPLELVPPNVAQVRQKAAIPTRLLIVWGVLLSAGLGLTINLYRLQIIQASSLQKKARQQQTVSVRPFVPRRPIVDRNGNVLAIDQPTYTLYIHPKLFKVSKAEIADKLAPLLERSPKQILKQIGDKPSGVKVVGNLKEDVANRLHALRADGVELIQEYSRLYPQTGMAADVLGYVDTNHQGQAGVEYSQQKYLERSVGTALLSRSAKGEIMPDRLPEGFLHFDDLSLQLTIDSQLQRAARVALQEKMKQFKAKRGAVIVMNAQDGSLLTLVSEPTYDPNTYYKYNLALFKNWALADLYEPGSTFKPINVAIALENGAIKPSDRFNDPGSISVGGWQIRNAQMSSHGVINISEILQYSSNVGMVQIMQRLKPGVYYSWLEKLGLGQKVGIDLPFEAPGQMKKREEFTNSPIEPATAAFGQGLSLTPIELVTLHATLANGGKLVTPHVVRGLFNSQGEAYWQPDLPQPRQVFSRETSQTVLEMMENVVTDGTGKAAQIPGYRIGGKTGTAQKAGPRGGYLSDAKITSFVGVLPVDSYRRYVILAVVDEPQGIAFGSTVAAPIVKSVMETLIAIEHLPPSDIKAANEAVLKP
ncbi:peptidoglycan D,D-transpeptidase FtsI family protein [Merismopedia glauca]|uniref:Cell division protein FtsI n=1 Tax=Merismopedia glauca CCAP 1448/3 TaxID=1296344 RepID=A0A2T1C2S6_9CYAN|nr:penicillin-binding protein 2 [Merismopedia glauca]PSB02570.1 cell division protein FtsI [Merismopedia glauca CCAP 1448/3]